MSLRPTFMGFETMKNAISAAQKSLDIVGSNMANANTEGYSRQRVDLCTVSAPGGSLYYKTSTSLSGAGVGMLGVTQLRDPFLDVRFRELNSETSDSSVKESIYTDIEDVLDIIDTAGFNESYVKFKDSLSKFVADSPNRVELANVVLGNAEMMVSSIKNYNTKLSDIENQCKYELSVSAGNVSSIISKISDFNKQVADSYLQSGDIIMDGSSYKVNTAYGPNELKDSRNLLLDELSGYGNVRVYDNDNGSIRVDFAGTTVVDDQKYSSLEYNEHSTGAVTLSVVTQGGIETTLDTGDNALSGGSLKGYLDMVNGAGVYAEDISIRKDGVQNAADEVNELLTKIKEYENEDAASKLVLYSDVEKQLEKYGDFTVDTATGEVTLTDKNGSVNVTELAADSTLTVHELKVNTADDNSKLVISVNSTELEFDETDDGELNKVLDETSENLYNSETEGIVYYRKVIDALANTLAKAFNNANSDTSNVNNKIRPMFEPYDKDTEITAENIKVSDAWENNSMLIAYKPLPDGSSEMPDMTELDPQYLNRIKSVISEKINFTIDRAGINDSDKIIGSVSNTLDEYISELSNSIAQNLSYEANVAKASLTMASSLSDKRDSVMGVDLNEEGANMLSYQKWYNAAARMMTTLDEALNTVINNMGLVGR